MFYGNTQKKSQLNAYNLFVLFPYWCREFKKQYIFLMTNVSDYSNVISFLYYLILLREV